MKVGSRRVFQACLTAAAFAAFCMWASTPASAQRSPAGNDETQISDQTGYQPTPEAEQPAVQYQRQEVVFRTKEAPGTVIIRTDERFLYVVLGLNRALRYGIGVGRDGFTWSGVANISRKEEWPDWRPPPRMIERQPYLPRFVAGGAGQSARRPRILSRPDGLSHPRHQSAADDRPLGLFGLLPNGQ